MSKQVSKTVRHVSEDFCDQEPVSCPNRSAIRNLTCVRASAARVGLMEGLTSEIGGLFVR